MVIGYLIVAIIAAAVAVFALQNGEPTTIRFLFWTLPSLTAGALALAALVAGMIVAGLPLLIHRSVLRSRIRRLEAMLGSLKHALKDRDRALLALKPELRIDGRPTPVARRTTYPPEAALGTSLALVSCHAYEQT